MFDVRFLFFGESHCHFLLSRRFGLPCRNEKVDSKGTAKAGAKRENAILVPMKSPAKDETCIFSRSIPTHRKGSDLLNQTKLLFPLIFISLEDDSSIVIPPQPTSPGEIMSGGEGEPVEADEPEEGENDTTPAETEHTISGVLASTETVTHEYLTPERQGRRETI